MASSLRRVASSSCSSPLYALLFDNSRAGHLGLSKIGLRYTELFSSIHASRFKSTFNFPKVLMQGLTSPGIGKRILRGCLAGISMTSAIIYHPPNIAYAMHEYKIESSGGDITEDFNTAWALARKYQLPLVILVMLILGWRHPVNTAINAIFFSLLHPPQPLLNLPCCGTFAPDRYALGSELAQYKVVVYKENRSRRLQVGLLWEGGNAR